MSIHSQPFLRRLNNVALFTLLVVGVTGSFANAQQATFGTTTITVGATPYAVAVNPATNKVYIGNQGSSDVTVITEATNATGSISVGPVSHEIAVNPVTNRIYEIDDSANVTVIDGATNTASLIALPGADPNGIAVNPATDMVYVTQHVSSVNSNFVVVINGATNGIVATLNPGNGPVQGGLGIDPITNRFYVANYVDGTVAVFDGATNALIATVPVGNSPEGLTVNPETNKIYVVNYDSDFMTIIDGGTNTTTNVVVGPAYVTAVADPITDKVYITDETGDLTVIDGPTATPTPVGIPFGAAVAVDISTDKIYVAEGNANQVGVLDGETGALIANVAAGNEPISIAADPVTHTAYAANYGGLPNYDGTTVTAISDLRAQESLPGASISRLAANRTSIPTPSFTFTVQSTSVPPASSAQNVFFQVDTWRGSWIQATSSGSSLTGTTQPLLPGFHVIYAYVGGAASLPPDSPLSGAIAAYWFVVAPQIPGSPAFTTQPASVAVNSGQSVAFFAASSGSPTPSYQWFLNGNPLSDGNGVSGANTATLFLRGEAAIAGMYSCTATNSAGSIVSNSAALTFQNQSPPSRLIDISARAFVGKGANVLIAGYVIEGGTQLPVLLRSSGPALSSLNLGGVLPDPELQLYSGNTVIDSNAGWDGNPQIAATANMVGAFAWQSPASKDSALLEHQSPGAFTAITSGLSGDTGIALAEVYDATPSGTWNASLSKLSDISARAFVGSGSNVLIGGFVIGGPTAKTVLVRASGPALGALGLDGTLPDPEVQLYSGANVIASNVGWGGEDSISAAASLVGAFTWNDGSSNDSAILVTLAPGAYTAVLSGASGDSGVALIEIYDVP
jgi:YVTN family beta-propeller protein